MGIDGRMLKKLIDNRDSPFIRCTGFLFIRFGLPHTQLWEWLEEYVLDDEEFLPSPDAPGRITVGEFIESLLTSEKYYDSVLLPRLPLGAKRKLEELLAPIDQYRRRTRANKDLLDLYRNHSLRVEAISNGDWLEGRSLELVDDVPSRIKVRVRLEDRSEENVHLGKVILRESASEYGSRGRGGGRDRSRSREKNQGKDWNSWNNSSQDLTRSRGRSDAELISEMRERDRDKAVTSGKDYARKPVGYKAACALPREQGQASYRLMEEETFVRESRPTRSRQSPEREEKKKEHSLEHQMRMKQLFEKYGLSRAAEATSARSDMEGPDHMRLG